MAIKKCRYLESSGCVGMCVNMCKASPLFFKLCLCFAPFHKLRGHVRQHVPGKPLYARPPFSSLCARA